MKSEIRRRRISAIIDYDWGNSGGGSPVTPLDIQPANLMRWLEPNKETGFVDGDLMGQITDWSGKGRHLVATGGNRGEYKSNIVNGKAVFRCAGNRMYSSIGGKPDDNFKHQGNHTTITVIRSSVDNNRHYLFDNCSNSPANIGISESFKVVASGINGGFETRIMNGSGTAFINSNLQSTAEGNPGLAVTGYPPTPKDVWLLIVNRLNVSAEYQSHETEVNNLLRGWSHKSGTISASDSTSDPVWFSLVGGATKGSFDLAFRAEWNMYLSDDDLNLLIGV